MKGGKRNTSKSDLKRDIIIWCRSIPEASKGAQDEYVNLAINLRAKFEWITKEAGATFYEFPESEKAKWANMMPDLPAEWIKEGVAMGLLAGEITLRFLELPKAEGHQFPREL
jgi:hypothetical protein